MTQIAFTGDVAFTKHFSKSCSDDNLLSEKIVNFLSSSDYTLVNVEGAVASNETRSDKPLTHANPLECVGWIKKVNGNIWNLANNHSMDCGNVGMQSTLDAAQKNGCMTVGAGMNIESAQKPVIIDAEGGPWGAYYPSKVNSLVPAKDEESAIGVVGVPHLNRDMLMAYIGRDDCYSSHSANVQRGMVNDGNKCQYLYDFIHQWVKQGDYNKDVYYNMFVGPNWLMEGKNFEESQEDSRDLYKQTLEECKRLEDEGKACICTMDEYAGYHKANHSPGECEVNHWKDLLYNSKREIVWYVSPQYRLAIDVCLGGTFVDLRPYAGEYEVETGINESNIWNGGYPFALSFPHRWSFHTATVNGVDLGTVRTRAKIENLENGEKRIILEPVGITVDDEDVIVGTTFDMKNGGTIKMTRKIISAPDKNKEYSISEDFKGCVGLNEYPVDFSGTVLKVTDKDGKIETLVAGYQDRKIGGCAIKGECDVEVLNTRFVFTPEGDSVEIYAEEGYMFAPYYTMRTIHNKIKEGEEAVTWLKIEKK